ncbi:Zinc finger, C3HC4 type (RING finger) family protein [Cryptosporidium meleagridis]|uniref:Zinc finger, C3HC4 type (RING finger) family protein n=1 Tax=Cryptosporidium meleagridis TaxID=93969 RepID=A0A2P4YZL1_9CRYT|nr:Zinc finger, C3HC4 type (RING finger) family protein [Cryptosporidium meleagridis]
MEDILVIECSKLYPALCFDLYGSPGFHNIYVGLLVIISGIWLVNRLSKIVEFYEIIRIIQEEGKVISIPSLGPYSNDLKKLIKPHISQIVRERCSISPINVKKLQVMNIMEESTLKTRLIPNSSSSSSPDESYSLEVSFKVDSVVPHSIQSFWGVDYFAVKELLIEERKVENELNAISNKMSRRMAIGSSISMFDQLKLKQRHNENPEENKIEKNINTGLEYDNFANNSTRLFEDMEIDDEKERTDLNIPFDFSPSESMKSLANINPILYTTEIANRRHYNYFGNSHDRDYFDYHANISRRGVFNIKPRITRIILKVKQRLRDNVVMNTISNSLNYSTWNSSLLGNNAIILSRSIKRLFENAFFYDTTSNINNNNSNHINLGRLALNKSSLLSSASVTTELLLDKYQDQLKSKSTSYNKYNIDLTKIINQPSKNLDEIRYQILIDKLNPMYVTEKKYYEKGLSQDYSEKIKLTQEYLTSCNLNSPYYDAQEQEIDSKDEHQVVNHGEYYEIQDKYNNKEILWNSDIVNFSKSNVDSSMVKIKTENKEMPRIPLLILIRANIGVIEDESILTNNIIVINFDLIQDHYNIPYLMYKPIILKQTMSNSHGILIEPYDTYGLEDDELDCLICMSNPKDVILLPCRHCISCESCLRSLRQDKCPLCRTTFSGFVVLPIKNS